MSFVILGTDLVRSCIGTVKYVFKPFSPTWCTPYIHCCKSSIVNSSSNVVGHIVFFFCHAALIFFVLWICSNQI